MLRTWCTRLSTLQGAEGSGLSQHLEYRKHILNSKKCCRNREKKTSKPSPIENLGPYLLPMTDHPRWCKKSSADTQFLCPAEGFQVEMKYDHRILHVIRKHGLKESQHDSDKDADVSLADVIRRACEDQEFETRRRLSEKTIIRMENEHRPE